MEQTQAQQSELRQAVRQFAKSVLAFVRGIVLAILAILTGILAYLGVILAIFAHAARRWVPVLIPVLAKLLCVAVPVASIASMFLPVCNALGGDFPATIASMPVLLAPVAISLILGFEFGGLLIAGIITYAIAQSIILATPVVRSIIILATVASIIISKLIGGTNEE